ncbi:hypothetical protein [Nocardia callitridis]|uniref:hypothetical protein n=1 Tax=Nocardia callitridis TaxID=648753 RepID=UPI0031E99369
MSVQSLYAWNLEVAASFYVPLRFLEVSIRNAMHEQLVENYSRPDWWEVAPLDKHSRTMIDKAAANVRRQGGRQPTTDHVVAALTFGFWLSLLSKRYDRYLWVPVLHKAFPYYHRDRASSRGFAVRGSGAQRCLASQPFLRNDLDSMTA